MSLIIGAETGKQRRAYFELPSGDVRLTEEVALDDPWWGAVFGRPSARNAIVGRCRAFFSVLKGLEQALERKPRTLIMGETGTGKKVLATALSSAQRGPFVSLNCAGLPLFLLESEIFGHEKGAFTGAIAQKKGKVELASEGTLLLDDIDDMELSVQAKLLDFAETRGFYRLGGTELLQSDAWIIAGANPSLLEKLGNGRFRWDLYYRLCVHYIPIPSLRERREDILLLAVYFIMQENAKGGRKVTIMERRAVEWIMRFFWPGNVRELQGAIEGAFCRGVGPVLNPDELDIERYEAVFSIVSGRQLRPWKAPLSPATKESHRVKDDEVLEAIKRNGGSATTEELSRSFKVAARTIQRYTESLRERGLVTRVREGKKWLYSATDPNTCSVL